MSAACARHVGPVLAHRDADVGLAQRGRVVHAVARHRHDVPARLKARDDAELLLGGHPGEDAHVLDARGELVVATASRAPRR